MVKARQGMRQEMENIEAVIRAFLANPVDERVVFEQEMPGEEDDVDDEELEAILAASRAHFDAWQRQCEAILGPPDRTQESHDEWIWELHPYAGLMSAWERDGHFLFVAQCQTDKYDPEVIVLGYRVPMDPDERMELG
jgi:hypothetical protein